MDTRDLARRVFLVASDLRGIAQKLDVSAPSRPLDLAGGRRWLEEQVAKRPGLGLAELVVLLPDRVVHGLARRTILRTGQAKYIWCGRAEGPLPPASREMLTMIWADGPAHVAHRVTSEVTRGPLRSLFTVASEHDARESVSKPWSTLEALAHAFARDYGDASVRASFCELARSMRMQHLIVGLYAHVVDAALAASDVRAAENRAAEALARMRGLRVHAADKGYLLRAAILALPQERASLEFELRQLGEWAPAQDGPAVESRGPEREPAATDNDDAAIERIVALCLKRGWSRPQLDYRVLHPRTRAIALEAPLAWVAERVAIVFDLDEREAERWAALQFTAIDANRAFSDPALVLSPLLDGQSAHT